MRVWLGISVELAVAVYLLGLVGWFLELQFVGDATWWLFTINAFAVYLFLPLPVALALSVWRRHLLLIAGSLAALALFAHLWGGLFWPPGRPQLEGSVLTVMTSNILGSNPDPAGVIESLRESDADVIGILDLSLAVSAAIEDQLAGEYPYRRLEPQPDTTGSGILSRFPFRSIEVDLADPEWIGAPMVVEVDFSDDRFVFLNAHSAARSGSVVARERQARLLSDYVASQTLPVILAGDFNAQDLNRSHAILTEHMHDAWRETGNGMGNTFPGASKDDSPGSNRPDFLGIDLPKWLIRIDYVFYSHDWQAIDARIGPWDGFSDHRPVIVEVVLQPQN